MLLHFLAVQRYFIFSGRIVFELFEFFKNLDWYSLLHQSAVSCHTSSLQSAVTDSKEISCGNCNGYAEASDFSNRLDDIIIC